MRYLLVQRDNENWQILNLTHISCMKYENDKLILPFYEPFYGPISVSLDTLCSILKSNRTVIKLYLNGTWE